MDKDDPDPLGYAKHCLHKSKLLSGHAQEMLHDQRTLRILYVLEGDINLARSKDINEDRNFGYAAKATTTYRIGVGCNEVVKNKLAEIASADQIPVRLGGTNERCIPQGGPIGKPKLRTKSTAGYISISRSNHHVWIVMS